MPAPAVKPLDLIFKFSLNFWIMVKFKFSKVVWKKTNNKKQGLKLGIINIFVVVFKTLIYWR